MSEHALSIRIADGTSAAAISKLLFEFNGEGLSPETLAQRLTEVQGLETVFLAKLDEALVGLLVLRTTPTVSGPEDWAEISELYVRPAGRRRGVGQALVGCALDFARDRGCTEVHLLVDPENAGALAFYKTLGFRRDSWDLVQTL